MNKTIDHSPIIVISAGEPAGIGADLCVMLAHQALASRIVVVADADLLLARAKLRKAYLKILPYIAGAVPTHAGDGTLCVCQVATAVPVQAGILDVRNSDYVLKSLRRATAGVLAGEFSALVTAPVHKGIINDAGFAFTGHTEFLAELTASPLPVMMLVGGGLRVALATIHLPLKEVPQNITSQRLEAILRILYSDLQTKFAIAAPRIAVAGLNPHAGEGGYLGREDIDIIHPVICALQKQGMAISGPWPADTLFTPQHLQASDAVLAMYHDQGLPVLKYASFGLGVNVTLGLPIIRTSVDHGTALNLVGSEAVQAGSMRMAVQLALQLSQR